MKPSRCGNCDPKAATSSGDGNYCANLDKNNPAGFRPMPSDSKSVVASRSSHLDALALALARPRV